MHQEGWEPKENLDWLVTMDTRALVEASDLLDQKAKRGNRVRMARLRGHRGPLEIGALWVTEETEACQGIPDILDRRASRAPVEIQASRVDLDIQDPGDGRDPKDQKGTRAQRENKARLEHQDAGGPRACRGSRGPGAWWGDRALRASLDLTGFLAGMVVQDSRGSRETMGTLASWALLEREEIRVWLAYLEHRDPQDSRVNSGYLGSWVPLASEEQREELAFLGTRGSMGPKASRVTLVKWASQEWLASSDPRGPLETQASKVSRALEGLQV